MSPDRRTAAVATAAVPNREATTAPTDVPMLLRAADNGPDVVLATLTGCEFILWLSGYRWGCVHGNAGGYAAAEADMSAAHAHLAASIRKSAGEPTHRQLVEQRWRHEVAAARRVRQPSADWPETARD